MHATGITAERQDVYPGPAPRRLSRAARCPAKWSSAPRAQPGAWATREPCSVPCGRRRVLVSCERPSRGTRRKCRARRVLTNGQFRSRDSHLAQRHRDQALHRGCGWAPASDRRGARSWPRCSPAGTWNESGYRDPNAVSRWHGRLDGLWNGATEMHQDIDTPMTVSGIRAMVGVAFPQPTARVSAIWVNIGSFTALVGVALSDQTEEGAGNLGVRPAPPSHGAVLSDATCARRAAGADGGMCVC